MGDTSCIAQPPGHTSKPEFHVAQLCMGRGGGETREGGAWERAEKPVIEGERQNQSQGRIRVTVHSCSFPKDLSLHYIDFFKVIFEK